MKVAFLTPEYPHSKTRPAGGIGTSIFNLAKGIVSLNHSVTILVYGQNHDEIIEENGIVIRKIKNIKLKGLSLFLTQKKVQNLINKLYHEKLIDIVEAPDWTGFTAFVNSKCPLVIRLNGSDTYFCHLDNRPVKAKNRFLEKRALINANAIISVSEFVGRLTNKLFHLNNNISVIPNSVDLSKFEPSINENQGQTILYFGTLIRKKGLLELPLIFNEVNKINGNAKLILVGKDSPDKQSENNSTWAMMQPLFTKKALSKVHYLGPVPYSEIRGQIESATVCVFPTFAEALPVSWIEAMAMKKAIVASDIGWAKEVIDNGVNGYIVHPKKHLEYADRIINLLADSNLRVKFGNNARIKVKENFSIEVVAEKSIDFYNNILIDT